MPATLHSKLPEVGTTIFTVMSELAAKHGAVNLAQGFPDFDPDPYLTALMGEYAAKGKNQYAPMPGLPALRQSLSHIAEYFHHIRYNPDTEITITCGATEAVFSVMACVLRPGDEVIIPEPCYDSYAPAARMQGAVPVYVRLQEPDFQLDLSLLATKITPRTRLIVINTPHNPTGTVFSPEVWPELAALLRDKNIFILSDEVYEHTVFDGNVHVGPATHPELKEITFSVHSLGKTFHATGWRCGYCMAPEVLMAEFRKAHQFITFAVHTPSQYALSQYISERGPEACRVADLFEAKRNLFLSEIKESKFTFTPVPGSYFQLLNCKDVFSTESFESALLMAEKMGVACIPVSAFYHSGYDPGFLRFCFAKKDETLIQAAQLLCKI